MLTETKDHACVAPLLRIPSRVPFGIAFLMLIQTGKSHRVTKLPPMNERTDCIPRRRTIPHLEEFHSCGKDLRSKSWDLALFGKLGGRQGVELIKRAGVFGRV
jgi:hypothetical protein